MIATIESPRRATPVPRKRPPQEQPSSGRQINFRAAPELASRLDRIAVVLGLDVSNLVRMILHENLATYEARADQIEGGTRSAMQGRAGSVAGKRSGDQEGGK